MSQALKNLLDQLQVSARAEKERRRRESSVSIAEELPELESFYERWLRAMFPDYFSIPFASYHHEFWSWGWSIERGVRPQSFFAIWPRMGGKSTHAEAFTVSCGARDVRRYFLYIGETQDQANDHVGNIESMLVSSNIARVYPELSEPKLGKFGAVKGWRRNRLRTASGFTVDALGLDTAARGLKLEEQRPDGLVFDDIDNEKDNKDAVEKKIKIITRSIIPAGAADACIAGVQNLIHKDSVFSQLMDGRAKFLRNRRVSGPTPAVHKLEYEERTIVDEESGKPREKIFITGGTFTWPEGMGKDRCEELIDDMDIEPFLIECHPLGTRIRVEGQPAMPIENVEVGDVVTTHLGRHRRVVDLVKRKYSGELFDIKRTGRSGVLQATANHPLYIARRPTNEKQWWYKKRDGQPKGARKLENLVYEWADVSTLRVGDFLLEPLPQVPVEFIDGQVIWRFHAQADGRPAKGNVEVRATAELCRLVGYFLAEGSLLGAYTAAFDFHKDEIEYQDDVIKLLEAVFGVSAKVVKTNGNGVSVRCCSVLVCQFFEQVGLGSRGKYIPHWVTSASEPLLAQVVIGYMRGDGCKDPSGFSFNTVSEALAEGLRLLMLRLGVVAGVYTIPPKIVKLPQGRLYEQGTQWMGDINASEAVKLGRILGVEHASNGLNRTFVANGYVHHSIIALSSTVVADFSVFNLEVEEDHSYLAEGVASHNCQHRTDIITGEKSFREYDEKYHVITMSEFVRYYDQYGKQARDEKGRPIMPRRWDKGRGMDFGTTPEHPTVVIHATRPYVLDPLKDICFWFGEICKPEWPRRTGREVELVSPGRVAAAMKELYARWRMSESEIKKSLMSHEQSAALNTMLVDLPEHLKTFFNKWKPRKGSGVPQIQEAQRIDRTRPHPFRRDPETGKPLMGYTRFIIVVADGQGELYYDDEHVLRVKQPVDSDGCIRLRSEIPEYNQYMTTKIFDDAVNAMCGLANRFVVASSGLTDKEEADQRLHPNLRAENLQHVPASLLEQAIISHEVFSRMLTEEEELARLVEQTEGSAEWWEHY